MANKFIPKVSAPGSAKFTQKGPHNPNVGTHGNGIAPKPSGGAPILGNDRPTGPEQASLARVRNTGSSPSGNSGPAGSFLPARKPQAGLSNQKIGQQNPNTSAAATSKPKRRGVGAAFYGEY
jgi:hypothetical protein